MQVLVINPRDNVAVALQEIKEGQIIGPVGKPVAVATDIGPGHKVALRDIKAGEDIIKYGFPIGHATQGIQAGAWVHTHNVKTNLGEILHYDYQPELPTPQLQDCHHTFKGYLPSLITKQYLTTHLEVSGYFFYF